VSQFFNSLTVRSEDQSILTIGVFTNRRLLLAGAFGIALVSCISYIPVLPNVFGTAGLTVWDWLMLVGFGLALLLADECRKAIVRHRRPQPRQLGAPPANCDLQVRLTPLERDDQQAVGYPASSTAPPSSQQRWTYLAPDHRSYGSRIRSNLAAITRRAIAAAGDFRDRPAVVKWTRS